MNTLQRIIRKAGQLGHHIVLPEGDDPRVVDAAGRIAEQGIARVSLIGENLGTGNQDGIDHIDPSDTATRQRIAEIVHAARQHKGLERDQALELARDPLVIGAALVRNGDADGMVAGAAHPTANVVRSALQFVGMSPDSGIVSSFFLMQHDLPHQAVQGTVVYADCAMVIDPDAEQLASIAIDSARSAASLADIDPKVALLSFSTAGSAEHPLVDKVRDAGKRVAERAPDLPLMTEVQFDAAIDQDILSRKAPDIALPAPANIFVFPDLQSANIGYKIAQRVGGVQAIGPVLQGLRKPVNDLSRGCSVEDIVNLVAVTAVQTGAE